MVISLSILVSSNVIPSLIANKISLSDCGSVHADNPRSNVKTTATKDIFLNILNAGIIIVTLADNQVYSREKTNDNWASLIMSIVIMSRANEESATKSRRIRASWDNKRQNITKKRFTARCPYWLKPSDGDTGFDLIPERVDVVKRIFQMSIDGIGTATIVKRLNGENVPLFSPKSDGWQTSYMLARV